MTTGGCPLQYFTNNFHYSSQFFTGLEAYQARVDALVLQIEGVGDAGVGFKAYDWTGVGGVEYEFAECVIGYHCNGYAFGWVGVLASAPPVGYRYAGPNVVVIPAF